MHVCVLSHFNHVQLFVTLWTVACQTPLWDSPGKNTGMGCYGPPPGDLPDPGIEPTSHVSCIGKQVLCHKHCLGSPIDTSLLTKIHTFPHFFSFYITSFFISSIPPGTLCYIQLSCFFQAPHSCDSFSVYDYLKIKSVI